MVRLYFLTCDQMKTSDCWIHIVILVILLRINEAATFMAHSENSHTLSTEWTLTARSSLSTTVRKPLTDELWISPWAISNYKSVQICLT